MKPALLKYLKMKRLLLTFLFLIFAGGCTIIKKTEKPIFLECSYNEFLMPNELNNFKYEKIRLGSPLRSKFKFYINTSENTISKNEKGQTVFSEDKDVMKILSINNEHIKAEKTGISPRFDIWRYRYIWHINRINGELKYGASTITREGEETTSMYLRGSCKSFKPSKTIF